jgi:hypothetical protein
MTDEMKSIIGDPSIDSCMGSSSDVFGGDAEDDET